MSDKCPVCDLQIKGGGEVRTYDDNKFGRFFSCARCGNYSLTDTLLAVLPTTLASSVDGKAILSHAIRKMQRKVGEPLLDSYMVDIMLRNTSLPPPQEQADNLILWLGENVVGPGEAIWVEPSTHQSIIGSKTPMGFELVLEHLFDIGLLTGNIAKAIGAPGRAHATLSMRGWEYFEQLKRGAIESRKAFMAMKYGEPVLDKIVDDFFKPAVKATGFTLHRLDEAPRAGLIDDRLRVEIRTSRFLISDLTHDNAGSYWEAGFAEGLGKPVIYTCEKEKFEKEKTHFDTNHHLTVLWSGANPMEAAELLKATIRATMPDEAILIDK